MTTLQHKWQTQESLACELVLYFEKQKHGSYTNIQKGKD